MKIKMSYLRMILKENIDSKPLLFNRRIEIIQVVSKILAHRILIIISTFTQRKANQVEN